MRWIFTLLALCSVLVVFAKGGSEWRSVGLGGGGALFAPAISPHNHRLLFVSSDMGGLFRSEDGGATWRLLDVRSVRGSTTSAPIFHPRDKRIIYHADSDGLKVSKDGGKRWSLMLKRPPWGDAKIRRIYIDGKEGRIFFVGLDDGAYISTDTGKMWRKCYGVEGEAVGFYVAEDQSLYVATTKGVWGSSLRSVGAVWTKLVNGLPTNPRIRSFCGGWFKRGRRGNAILYSLLSNKGKRGGIYRSTDGGRTWKRIMGGGINEKAKFRHIACAENRPTVVYATCEATDYEPPEHFTVWKSTDAGKSWKFTYNGDPRWKNQNIKLGWLPYDYKWGWGGAALGFCVARNDYRHLIYTDSGQIHISIDAGANWYQAFTRFADTGTPSAGKRWESCGLEVTTVWGVYFDITKPERLFICYTDIGLARSEDGGRTWTHSVKGSPWKNTFYELAFDVRRNLIYAAAADMHDIPHWKAIEGEKGKGGGGVLVSSDGGKSWKVLGKDKGLPKGPCTSVALHPQTKDVYCVIYGEGVFVYDKENERWFDVTGNMADYENPHFWRIKFHPDGTLFCLITGWREGSRFEVKGALWRSKDNGKSWQNITKKLKLYWPMGFDFDPTDSDVIYLAFAAAPRLSDGGLLKTTDGGKRWKELKVPYNRKFCSYVHGYAPIVSRRNPKLVFLATATHGLFASGNGGRRWVEISSLPFLNIHSVTFNPREKDEVFISTMGAGVLRGRLRFK